jgi:hypothetical protein
MSRVTEITFRPGMSSISCFYVSGHKGLRQVKSP